MRKKEGNKEQAILNAAIKVFAESGFHKAKVTTIAETAGVATGSVYLYYESKEAILVKIFDELWKNYIEALQKTVKRTDIQPLEKIDAVIDHLFNLFIANPSLALVFVNEHYQLIKDKKGNVPKHYENFMKAASEIYREGMKDHLFNPRIDIRIYWDFITGGLRNVLRAWAENPREKSLDTIRDNVKLFMKNGLLIR